MRRCRIRNGLARLEVAVQEIRAASAGETITISAWPGFAAFWLIPRLPLLQAAFPNHDLCILSGGHSDDVTHGDLQIRFGDGRWPDIQAEKILGEEVFAVCSPRYLRGRRTPLPLRELKAARLLRLVENTPRWYGWTTWFEALGSPLKRPSRTLDFDSYPLLASAALAGQGIALCWDGLLDEFLNNGALVRVTADSVPSTRGYFVTHRTGIEPDSAIRAVSKWLRQNAVGARPAVPMGNSAATAAVEEL